MSNEGGFGKAMAGMMKQEIAGVRRFEQSTAPVMPKVGDTVRLVKRAVQEGAASTVSAGEAMEGKLLREITLGEQIFHSGGQTSAVQAMRLEGDKIVVETKTSVYEVSRG